jgi:tRNA (Thr-GGU) A37 N-methylase
LVNPAPPKAGLDALLGSPVLKIKAFWASIRIDNGQRQDSMANNFLITNNL